MVCFPIIMDDSCLLQIADGPQNSIETSPSVSTTLVYVDESLSVKKIPKLTTVRLRNRAPNGEFGRRGPTPGRLTIT